MTVSHRTIPRDWGIWVGAVLLSVTLHLLVFVERGSVAGQERPVTEQTTRVSFRSVAAPQTPPQPEVTEEEPPAPEPEVIEAPEPLPEPKPKEVEKKAEKVRQVEPPKPAPKPQPAPSANVAEKLPEPVEQNSGSVEDPALLEQAKHEYLRRLMAHIESHKHYPRVARRRGIEGDVAVSFRLRTGGEVSDLIITEGHRVLRKAVKEAIAAAHPFPVPPESLRLPMKISFSMQFSLKGS